MRKSVERSSIYPYHVYNRTVDKIFYPLSSEKIWNEACDLLRILSWTFGAKIHAFVLMSNHYHLLISTPDENLGQCMRYFQSELSRWIRLNTQSERFSFCSRYKWTIIKKEYHYAIALKYIYQNPLRAKIVTNVKDYPWSSAAHLFGLNSNSCPLNSSDWSSFIPDDLNELELWLNYMPNVEENEKVKRALSKRTFKIPKRIHSL